MTELIGLGLLLVLLASFSLISFKAPKGGEAMSGMANAAVATFLVEAVHKYISGDLFKIALLGQTGISAGSMGGVAAGIMVPLAMGVNPVFAIVSGVALGGYGILPGFISGYIMGFVAPILEKKLPAGVNVILGALILAPLSRICATLSSPVINIMLEYIGNTVESATAQSPILMGFLIGGIIKIICTSPLSSMALTAMLGLKGLPMGIAAIACFGGAFTNGVLFKMLNFGDRDSTLAVMIEPLTQAHIVTKFPIPIYCSDFLGGGLAGIGAVLLNIVNNAPGTASPIPGMIAPFAFNNPKNVVIALIIAAISGSLAGIIGGKVFEKPFKQERIDSKLNLKKSVSL